MNKFSKILYAAMALAMAVCNFSCSDDEELPTGELELNSGSSVTTETLKVLSYNVLEGMKLDKANDYNNFVTWVSEQAPDIMAIEETNGFTKEKLTALSARWGHPYAEMCKESGYPVSITSKYPIEVVSRILDGVWHAVFMSRSKVSTFWYFIFTLSRILPPVQMPPMATLTVWKRFKRISTILSASILMKNTG